MATKQINVKITSSLYNSLHGFAESYGYRNVQEVILDSVREKIFEKSEFDEGFSEKEIELIDKLIEKSVKKRKFVNEKELMKALE